MKHIKDLVVRGHEVIILQDTLTELYAVDIRADNNDGDIIAGYAEFATETDARYTAMAYLDGVYHSQNQTTPIISKLMDMLRDHPDYHGSGAIDEAYTHLKNIELIQKKEQ